MNATKNHIPGLKRVRAWMCGSVWLVLVIAVFNTAFAQPAENPVKRPRMDTNTPAPNSQPVGGGTIKAQGRPFYLQGAVTALIAGGAIWTVCRSSRRM